MIKKILIFLFALMMIAKPAKAEWLLSGSAEVVLPLQSELSVGDSRLVLDDDLGGGFAFTFGAEGLADIKGLVLSLDYIFTHHRAKQKSASGTAIFSPANNYIIRQHTLLSTLGWRFGKESGLGNFGISLLTGLGFNVVNFSGSGNESLNGVRLAIPFEVNLDYRINEIFGMGFYSRFLLTPTTAEGKITSQTNLNGANGGYDNLGGIAGGISFDFVF